MTWLVNEFGRYRITLGEGEIVTTGTCIVPVPVAPGDVVTGDYGAFGFLQVRFTDQEVGGHQEAEGAGPPTSGPTESRAANRDAG